MPHLLVNDVELFYDIRGTGEPLLLIAGYMCDHAYWSLLLPALIKQYQIIRFDNRGIGRSSTHNSPCTIPQMANDAAVLLDKLGIAKAHVIGHSMGGQIAQELALAHPDKVKSLTLLATWAKGDRHFYSIIENWGDLADKLDLALYQKVILPWIFSDDFYSQPEMIEMLIELALRHPFPPQPQILYHHSRAILASDTTNRLPKIQSPTLVIVGKNDILTPVKFSQQLAQNIPQAELLVLDYGRHSIVIESPDLVTSAILEFLEKLKRFN
ncbi:MAG TPA: alpha/beta hydrolase [Nostocaceae cyanobacterium]|nr:alpha/beta hydrolase [Nostocaceae cyanobacterium]